MDVVSGLVTTSSLVDAINDLADIVEMSGDAESSVVCLIRVGGETRLYALGDDLDALIAKASAYMDSASLAIAARTGSLH